MLGSTANLIESKELEHLLGITSPWSIQSVKIDEATRKLNIHITQNGVTNSTETIDGCWQFISIGGFQCFIHAKLPKTFSDDAIVSRKLILQPSFIGHPSRQYSNFVRQQLSIAQLKGIEPAILAEHIHIEKSLIRTIQDDLKNSSTQARLLASLPTEFDPIWIRVLHNEVTIDTQVLPLKFLLSKLKMRANKAKTEQERQSIIFELRKFFVENASIVDMEIDQLCGILSRPQQTLAQAEKSKNRLILPSIKSPIWIDILTGKLRLNSLSVPLNLLISRQRAAFIQGKTNREKIHSVEIIHTYFYKNYRTLKAELILINRAINIRNRNSVHLPDPESHIWQQILTDDNFVPSENIAYKLLLTRLRNQVRQEADPVVKIEAARRIRDFIKQNRLSMKNELTILLKQTTAQAS